LPKVGTQATAGAAFAPEQELASKKAPGSSFKFATTKEFEPDLSDEALENMVPPPKRKIREDTPLDAVAPSINYSIANYTNRVEEEPLPPTERAPIANQNMQPIPRPAMVRAELEEPNMLEMSHHSDPH
jgi:hypothetical protein